MFGNDFGSIIRLSSVKPFIFNAFSQFPHHSIKIPLLKKPYFLGFFNFCTFKHSSIISTERDVKLIIYTSMLLFPTQCMNTIDIPSPQNTAAILNVNFPQPLTYFLLQYFRNHALPYLLVIYSLHLRNRPLICSSHLLTVKTFR